MIDTLRLEWPGVGVDPSALADYQKEFKGFSVNMRPDPANESKTWLGAMWEHPVHGMMGVTSRQTGTRLWAETSLGKYARGENKSQMTEAESLETVDAWAGDIESMMKDYFLPSYGKREQARPLRIDPYYQQKVESSAAVCTALAESLRERGRLAQYMTSVEVLQSRVFRGRFYDKGIESKDEAYYNVLRHEEQIRTYNRAGAYLNMARMQVDREALREHMNKRFEGWPTDGIEVPDLGALVREYGNEGLAAAALVLCPALEADAKSSLAKNTFYKRKNLAMEFRRRTVKVDLRVPENAWK